jgi:hypothetical protein
VSEHKDADFQRQQLAQITAEQKDDDEPASNPDSSTAAESPRPKKKQKVVISTAQAASLVQKVSLLNSLFTICINIFVHSGNFSS